MSEKFQAWITKHALTEGITEKTVEACFYIAPDFVIELGKPLNGFHKGDWHHTREAAVERAEQMREARIKSLEKSLEKSIAKLKKMTF